MKQLPHPNDPYALQARVMDAVIGDLLEGKSTRWNAMREIRKQEKANGRP
jgi:hypothetical protein